MLSHLQLIGFEPIKFKIVLLSFFFIPFFSHSQDKSEDRDFKMGDYVIKSIINSDKTYGFEIYKDKQNKPLLQQKIKPFSKDNEGFKERQNAMVAAMWYVSELQDGRNDIKKLTLTRAKELGITDRDLNP